MCQNHPGFRELLFFSLIKKITEITGATVDVQDDGTILISSVNGEANDRAIEMIEELTEDAEVGKYYEGTVVKITDFGAFVEILPGTDGLVHISRLDNYRVDQVTDVFREGDKVLVKCIGVDSDGKISLSRKDALGMDINGNPIEGYEPPPPPPPRPRDRHDDRRERGRGGGRGRGRR